MGNLARYLAAAFCEQCPRGWTATTEASIDPAVQAMIHVDSRADVRLTTLDGARRIWVEFEISRADPVANHAKFAVAHGFVPQGPGDTFVSMVSAHVVGGRRSLASAAVLLMRQVGMSAFQTPLLPHLSGSAISGLNGLNVDALRGRGLPVRDEIDRVLRVVDAIAERQRYRLHFAASVDEVLLNARRWNAELSTAAGAALWRRAPFQYFVYDDHSKAFAPSKFCAFVPVPRAGATSVGASTGGFATAHLMSVGEYIELDESEPRFDGHRARTHLEQRLLMAREVLDDRHELAEQFAQWRARRVDAISVRGQPEVLRAAPWSR